MIKSKNLFTSALMAFLFLFAVQANAQKFSELDKSPMDVAAYPSDYKDANKLIKIQYSRPQLNGRELSKLAPNGKVWRTGANEAAELTLYADLKVGGKLVKAGTYTFYTIPGDKEWTAIISKDLNVWGSYFYKEANDVVRIKVPVTTSSISKPLEAFSMTFEEATKGVNLHIGWGTMRAAVPFMK